MDRNALAIPCVVSCSRTVKLKQMWSFLNVLCVTVCSLIKFYVIMFYIVFPVVLVTEFGEERVTEISK